jgi:DhnA family fructose-bisphosphate aldolase class Ia
MSGIEIRISKIFKNKNNVVLSALDHVMEYGVQPGIEDPKRAIENCLTTDALLLPRFMLKRNWNIFAQNIPAPVPIVRINWTSSFYYPLDYREGNTVIATEVDEAVAAGAEAVICSLFLEEDNSQERETNNIKIFSEVVRQKEKLGIPLIGECYVVEHKDKTDDEIHSKVKRVSRVMVELGADMVKVFFTGDRFHEVVENTPVPVFTIGAEKLNKDLDVLKKAKASIDQGARGIVFGRNIFLANDPAKMVKALNEVLNEGVDPEKAADNNNLI